AQSQAPAQGGKQRGKQPVVPAQVAPAPAAPTPVAKAPEPVPVAPRTPDGLLGLNDLD
ncbi:MAG: hypothetical protein HOV78_23150, partial [Hamadaea sp.]|nr:hypothetical protein [Hamadaea sp.]